MLEVILCNIVWAWWFHTKLFINYSSTLCGMLQNMLWETECVTNREFLKSTGCFGEIGTGYYNHKNKNRYPGIQRKTDWGVL